MAVATSTKGRDLAPYLVLRDQDLEVLITPELARMAHTIHVEVKRSVRKGLAVRFSNTLD